MEGLNKSLAEMNALSAAGEQSAERLREHNLEAPKAVNPADEREKTLAGTVIGGAWDLVAGQANTAQGRVERAHKADEYAEIAADTFACIPKFKAITGGIARSVLLIDVSGQHSAGDVFKGMATNFFEGAALNGVTKMASRESFVGKAITARLGNGLGAEVVTHGIAGGGFGFVKSTMASGTWMDERGQFSFVSGLRNVAVSTSIGSVIGVPAGMAGQRFGKVVAIGMGAEQSAVTTAVQKIATGAGGGFASGSVFGGVEAMRSGKSMSEILDKTLEGGVVGAITGGVTSGFDKNLIRPTVNELTIPRHTEPVELRLESSSSGGRNERQLSLTDRIVQRSDELLSTEGVTSAFDRFLYKPAFQHRVEKFAHRLSEPVVEDRRGWIFKPDAPKTHAQMVEALKKVNPDGEPLDINKHFYDVFAERGDVSMRVYNVEGHSTRVVVPEAYAKQLDEVRQLRKINDQPTAYDKLSLTDRTVVAKAMKAGDANVLYDYMTPQEVTQYIKIYQAGLKLKEHPMAYRALPEDIVPALDMLPHRGLVKEVHLLDTRNDQDVFKSVVYNRPDFEAAATVTPSGIVEFYQTSHNTQMYEYMMHEWSHLAKWNSPAMSKMFDLASVVDHVDNNIDFAATRTARQTTPDHPDVLRRSMYYYNEHSTRNQDENFAVPFGEAILAPDPTHMISYTGRAPVRAFTLAAALDKALLAGSGSKSSMYDNFSDRARYISEASKSHAIGTLEHRLDHGTPAEKAAAAQLMAHFGTVEQTAELLAVATDKANRIVPDWKGTAAEEAMSGSTMTVAQHAFDSVVALNSSRESLRMETAIELMIAKPELHDMAVDYLSRSKDSRAASFLPMASAYNPNGTPAERAAGITLIKKFGGAESTDMLLKIALQKGNDVVPNFREARLDPRLDPRFGNGRQTVAEIAYNAYVESARTNNNDRFQFAFEQGMQHPKQLNLAANYLVHHGDPRARGYGSFLMLKDMPGHTAKMQELITGEFRGDHKAQKLVFDRMMQLTDTQPKRQLELMQDTLLNVPALTEAALGKAEAILTRGATSDQRMAIQYMLTQKLRSRDVTPSETEHINAMLAKAQREAKILDAIASVQNGRGDKVTALHALSSVHDQRAIKPLLQQAVGLSSSVSAEAIQALQQYNPNLVKFYAQELKREYRSNPAMTVKIADLMSSGKLSGVPRSARGG